LSKLITAALLASLGSLPAHAASQAELERGRYLAAIMDCGGCHTPGAAMGKPDTKRALAGGDIGFAIPGIGTFYPPNLTSDRETGLGAWSAEEVDRAVRKGMRPDGRELAPAMPWRAYAAMTDADAAALAAYLKSLPAVQARTPGPFGPTEAPTAPHFTVQMPK